MTSIIGYPIPVIPTSAPSGQPEPPTEHRRFLRVLAWSSLAAIGGAIVYSLFTILTNMEASLIGIPIGLAVGQVMYYASGNRGGRGFQFLAVLLAFMAFDLTYAPGMAGVALKDGVTVLTFGFFVFMTAVSPAIDAHNGFLGQFMVVAGMYLAWTLARTGLVRGK